MRNRGRSSDGGIRAKTLAPCTLDEIIWSRSLESAPESNAVRSPGIRAVKAAARRGFEYRDVTKAGGAVFAARQRRIKHWYSERGWKRVLNTASWNSDQSALHCLSDSSSEGQLLRILSWSARSDSASASTDEIVSCEAPEAAGLHKLALGAAAGAGVAISGGTGGAAAGAAKRGAGAGGSGAAAGALGGAVAFGGVAVLGRGIFRGPATSANAAASAPTGCCWTAPGAGTAAEAGAGASASVAGLAASSCRALACLCLIRASRSLTSKSAMVSSSASNTWTTPSWSAGAAGGAGARKSWSVDPPCALLSTIAKTAARAWL